MIQNRELNSEQQEELINILKARFEKNRNRLNGLEWATLQTILSFIWI